MILLFYRPADPVDIQDVTQVQLVAYHPEKDLIPIVLANCNYTLTVGQEMTIEYDFDGMERQVEERFIRGRPRVNPKVCTLFIYSTCITVSEFNSARRFCQQN